MHPKPLDDIQDVNLQVELLLRVLLHPVFALHCRSTTEAALVAKVAQPETSTVLVGEELPVDDCFIQAPLQAFLEVFDGFCHIIILTHLLIVKQLVLKGIRFSFFNLDRLRLIFTVFLLRLG